MRKSSLFLSLFAFIANAHATLDDDIFTVINKTNRTLRISVVGEGNDAYDGSTLQWRVQSEIDGGQKKIFKRKELGDAFRSEQIKAMRISNLGISLDDAPQEREHVLKLSRFPKHSFVITDAFLRNLGLIK